MPIELALHAPHAAHQAWRAQLDDELRHNILPWWRTQMLDPAGGWFGGRANNGELRNELPRSAVLGSRLLWTFAETARLLGEPTAHTAAEHGWRHLQSRLWDAEHGGVFWSVDACGQALEDDKRSYAQGFAIYALVAWHRASGDARPLQRAQQIFELLEAHAYDPQHGAYFEGCSRNWQRLPDARLSALEPRADKTMNTLLHLLEGFTELLRVWPPSQPQQQTRLRARVRELLRLFHERIWQAPGAYFGQFFDADWRLLSEQISYGHDIETSWLLVRAAEVLGEPAWLQRSQALSAAVAAAVLARGVRQDGSVRPDSSVSGEPAQQSDWWCQAEAMVGFWDAYQWHQRPEFADAARRSWAWIQRHHIDTKGGDWFKRIDGRTPPSPQALKAGPWDCPYHHARACLEMMARLDRPTAAAR